MAGGILPGLALINNFDANGELMRGGLLRLYQAGTNTPTSAFKDSALTPGQEHPWPIPADSAARLPMFYLPSGTYRVRLSSSDGGYVAYDVPSLDAVSPSGGGGGGGGGTVSPQVLFQTGYLLSFLGSGVRDGFVRLNGRTIGSTISGATERANQDTQSLYEFLWNEFDNTICPVLGGRGISATADFNAAKQLTLIDGRGRTLFGADGMGATVAGRLTVKTFATPDAVGTGGGFETRALLQANLPNVRPTFTGTQDTFNVNTSDTSSLLTGTALSNSLQAGDSGVKGAVNLAIGKSLSGQFTPAGTISALGSGDPVPAVPPGLIVTYYVKL